MHNILLIKTHALGDVLLTTPVVRALHKKYPDSRLYYLTGLWSEPAVSQNPYIEGVFTIDENALFKGRIHKLLPMIFKLRKYQFDVILIFSGSILLHGIARLISSGIRIGFSENRFLLTHSIPLKILQKHYAPQAYCSFLEPLGIGHDGYFLDFIKRPVFFSPKVNDFFLKYKIVIGFFCGGGKNPKNSVPAKQWSKENFISLGKLFSRHNYGIVLFGSHPEQKLNKEISMELGSNSIDLNGLFDFSQTADVMGQCNLFITNDSAPFHLAYTSGVKTLGLFGPSNPDLLAPAIENCRVIKSTRHCSPCYGNSIFNACENPTCMSDISVAQVFEEAEKFLACP